jgi:hypothetical protein
VGEGKSPSPYRWLRQVPISKTKWRSERSSTCVDVWVSMSIPHPWRDHCLIYTPRGASLVKPGLVFEGEMLGVWRDDELRSWFVLVERRGQGAVRTPEVPRERLPCCSGCNNIGVWAKGCLWGASSSWRVMTSRFPTALIEIRVPARLMRKSSWGVSWAVPRQRYSWGRVAICGIHGVDGGRGRARAR